MKFLGVCDGIVANKTVSETVFAQLRLFIIGIETKKGMMTLLQQIGQTDVNTDVNLLTIEYAKKMALELSAQTAR